MKYALNLADDGRILSATYPQYAPNGAVIVEALPEGNVNDYLYVDGKYIYDPIPVPETPTPAPTLEEEVAALKEQLAAAKILLGVV